MSGDEHTTDSAFSEAQIQTITSVVESVLEKSLEATTMRNKMLHMIQAKEGAVKQR